MIRCLSLWISLEGFNKKEIQVNLYKMFSFLIFNELYLFNNDSQSPKTRGTVAFMKYLGSVVSLVFLPKTSIWNKITFRRLNFFDRVWYDGVIYKIKCIGIIGMFLKFITSFLESKLHSVVLNGQTSSWETVLAGAPQSSALGPLFFLIYINYLLKIFYLTQNSLLMMRLFFSTVKKINVSTDQLNSDLEQIWN